VSKCNIDCIATECSEEIMNGVRGKVVVQIRKSLFSTSGVIRRRNIDQGHLPGCIASGSVVSIEDPLKSVVVLIHKNFGGKFDLAYIWGLKVIGESWKRNGRVWPGRWWHRWRAKLCSVLFWIGAWLCANNQKCFESCIW